MKSHGLSFRLIVLSISIAFFSIFAVASSNIKHNTSLHPLNGEDVVSRHTQNNIDVGGQPFHSTRTKIQGQGREITLIAKGKSYLTYFSLAICSAVLYLEPRTHNSAVQSLRNNETVALEISYHKPVRASDFRWATNTYTKKNGHSSNPHVQELIASFNDLYRDVERGDRYLLEYDPRGKENGKGGISLSLNGSHLGSVGRDSPYELELARAIYSIWFGDRPFFERLKKDLLTPISMNH